MHSPRKEYKNSCIIYLFTMVLSITNAVYDFVYYLYLLLMSLRRLFTRVIYVDYMRMLFSRVMIVVSCAKETENNSFYNRSERQSIYKVYGLRLMLPPRKNIKCTFNDISHHQLALIDHVYAVIYLMQRKQ